MSHRVKMWLVIAVVACDLTWMACEFSPGLPASVWQWIGLPLGRLLVSLNPLSFGPVQWLGVFATLAGVGGAWWIGMQVMQSLSMESGRTRKRNAAQRNPIPVAKKRRVDKLDASTKAILDARRKRR